ncbi:MAG: hypothetical protein M3081_07685, partial [Gemmatimonadota bacterium]|nr:hypothetical protein [Gemmatimonadota bacterium]
MKKFFYGGLAAAMMLAAAACNSDRLTVPNYQNPTPPAVAGDPRGAVQLFVNGILFRDRQGAAGYINGVGRLGRESQEFANTEARNISHYVTSLVNDPTGFASGGNFGLFYTELLESSNFQNTINGLTSFTAAEKSASLGFAHTFDAYELYLAITVRGGGPGSLAAYGLPVTINADPAVLTPFVSRDSVYNYIIGLLNQAKTELAAGGAAFPFSLNAGFTSNGTFNTPATFLQFNRALAARVNATRASLGVAGCGAPKSAACYTTVLTNLTESFFSPAPADFTKGVYRIYSTAANDAVNGFAPASDPSNLAHPSIRADAQAGDTRVAAKTFLLASPIPSPGNYDIATNVDFLL